MEEFVLSSEYIELCKLLKACGWCHTGGRAKLEIEAGKIKLNGLVELRKRCKIRPGQTVEFEGNKLLVKSGS